VKLFVAQNLLEGSQIFDGELRKKEGKRKKIEWSEPKLMSHKDDDEALESSSFRILSFKSTRIRAFKLQTLPTFTQKFYP
jgi:hypothetical protein